VDKINVVWTLNKEAWINRDIMVAWLKASNKEMVSRGRKEGYFNNRQFLSLRRCCRMAREK
jgi:hypothetical protein